MAPTADREGEKTAASQDDAEVQRVSAQVAGRLAALGVWLGGRESPDELVAIEEAVERFEESVRAHGGDLMVDEGPQRPHGGAGRRPLRPADPRRARDRSELPRAAGARDRYRPTTPPARGLAVERAPQALPRSSAGTSPSLSQHYVALTSFRFTVI